MPGVAFFPWLGLIPVQELITIVRSHGGPWVDKDAVKSVLSEILPDFSSAVVDTVMKKYKHSCLGPLQP
jgi:hypothetical protein